MATNSPSVPSPSISDLDLRSVVSKDSDSRLQTEYTRGQDYYDKDTVKLMSRSLLIDHVTALRKCAGQSTAVKGLITGFDPVNLGLEPPPSSPKVPEVHTRPPPPSVFDPSVMLMRLFQQQMEDRKEERRLQEEKERKQEERERKLEEERREER